jgi:flagellar export protein FliJ
MARDPLVVLARLQGMALDAARRALADRLGEQDAAAERSAAVVATLAQETAAQAHLPEFAASPDTYATWLRRMQQARQAAQRALHTATGATAAARATVNEERVAVRALEVVVAKVRERRRREAARQEQRVLDEAAGLRGNRPRWSG